MGAGPHPIPEPFPVHPRNMLHPAQSAADHPTEEIRTYGSGEVDAICPG